MAVETWSSLHHQQFHGLKKFNKSSRTVEPIFRLFVYSHRADAQFAAAHHLKQSSGGNGNPHSASKYGARAEGSPLRKLWCVRDSFPLRMTWRCEAACSAFAEVLWRRWSDVATWPQWDPDIESSSLQVLPLLCMSFLLAPHVLCRRTSLRRVPLAL